VSKLYQARVQELHLIGKEDEVFVQLSDGDHIVVNYPLEAFEGVRDERQSVAIVWSHGMEYYAVISGRQGTNQWDLLWKGDWKTCFDFWSEMVEDMEPTERGYDINQRAGNRATEGLDV